MEDPTLSMCTQFTHAAKSICKRISVYTALLSTARGFDHEHLLLDQIKELVRILRAGWKPMQPLDKLNHAG